MAENTEFGPQPADVARMISMLRVMANGTRLMILNHLKSRECSVAQIEGALHIGQPILSQQLAELREAGVVTARREGKSVFYRLHGDAMARFVELLGVVALDREPGANDVRKFRKTTIAEDKAIS
jgi:ArsR family transcriptional regulator